MFFHRKLSGGEQAPSSPTKIPSTPKWDPELQNCPQALPRPPTCLEDSALWAVHRITGQPRSLERPEAGPWAWPGRAVFSGVRGACSPQQLSCHPYCPAQVVRDPGPPPPAPCPPHRTRRLPSLTFPEGRLRCLELIRL